MRLIQEWNRFWDRGDVMWLLCRLADATKDQEFRQSIESLMYSTESTVVKVLALKKIGQFLSTPDSQVLDRLRDFRRSLESFLASVEDIEIPF